MIPAPVRSIQKPGSHKDPVLDSELMAGAIGLTGRPKALSNVEGFALQKPGSAETEGEAPAEPG